MGDFVGHNTAESTKRPVVSIGNINGPGRRLTCQSLSNLLVDDDMHLDTPIGRSSQHVVQSVLLIARRGSSKVKLRA